MAAPRRLAAAVARTWPRIRRDWRARALSSFHAAMLAAATGAGRSRCRDTSRYEQERLDERRVAGDIARAQSRRVRPLDRLPKTTSRGKPSRPSARAAASAPQRRTRLVEVDFRIALVRGDHEAVRSDSAKSSRQPGRSSTRPVGLSGEHTYSNCVRAQTSAGTGAHACAKPAAGIGIDARSRAGAAAPRLRRSDRTDSGTTTVACGSARVDHGLGKREQRLAAAQVPAAPASPDRARAGRAGERASSAIASRSAGGAGRRGIIRERARARVQRVDDEARRRALEFAQRQADRAFRRGRA